MMQQPLLPAAVEGGGAGAHEPRPRLARQRAQDQERVDPAAVQRADRDVATLGEVLTTLHAEPQAAEAEEERVGDCQQEPVEEGGSRRRGAAQPVEPLRRRSGQRGREGLGSARLRDAPVASTQQVAQARQQRTWDGHPTSRTTHVRHPREPVTRRAARCPPGAAAGGTR